MELRSESWELHTHIPHQKCQVKRKKIATKGGRVDCSISPPPHPVSGSTTGTFWRIL